MIVNEANKKALSRMLFSPNPVKAKKNKIEKKSFIIWFQIYKTN
jgi:hypothetical protein